MKPTWAVYYSRLIPNETDNLSNSKMVFEHLDHLYNGKLNERVAPFSSLLFWAQIRPP